ncbi:MAG: hypothetical protein LJE84_07495 [Gammaproteobacteria bacterium]|nr:hypothetical protein [Gammaproteobacteria bacterium]
MTPGAGGAQAGTPLVVALRRYWPLAAAVLCFALGAATWINLATGRVYESMIEIRIGAVAQVWQPGEPENRRRRQQSLLSKPRALRDRLKGKFSFPRDGAWLDSVRGSDDWGYVFFFARATTPEGARDLLQTVRDEFLAQQQEQFAKRVAIQRDQLLALQQYRDGLAQELRGLPVAQAPDRYAALLAEQREIEKQLARARELATDRWTYPTLVSRQPQLNRDPVRPTSRRNLAVALVVGGLFGLLLAMGMQLLRGGGGRRGD